MSEVHVSVSIESMLNDSSTATLSIRSSVAASTSASVKMYASIVAMFGSIILAPFATQVIVASPTEIEIDLG